MADVVVANNRAPVSFDSDGHPARGAGGVAAALATLMAGENRLTVASAMNEADRRFAAAAPGRVQTVNTGRGRYRLRLVDVPPDDYRQYYDVIANRFLWFALHWLFDPVRRPLLDRGTYAAWDRYVAVNHAFASVCGEEVTDDDCLLVQDYHLALVPRLVRGPANAARIAHFTHTAWPRPQALAVLPDAWVREIVNGMLGAAVVGFHSARWARNFAETAAEVAGATRAEGGLIVDGRTVRLGVFPLGPDADSLRAEAASPATAGAGAELDELIDGRRLILRIERLEPAKNALRGLLAYERILEDHPGLRKTVLHIAQLYPSRVTAPEYIAYRDAVEAVAARIDAHFPNALMVFSEDNFPRAMAAYARYDVLVVNSIADGLNLVAKEGPVVNERDGVVVLSREAGAIDQLEGAAFVVNPYDTTETAEAIYAALSSPPDERKRRSEATRRGAVSCSPTTWLEGQLRALDSA